MVFYEFQNIPAHFWTDTHLRFNGLLNQKEKE